MWLDFAELQPLLRQNERSLQTFLSHRNLLEAILFLEKNKTTQWTRSQWTQILKRKDKAKVKKLDISSRNSLHFTLLYYKDLLIAMQNTLTSTRLGNKIIYVRMYNIYYNCKYYIYIYSYIMNLSNFNCVSWHWNSIF